MGIDRSIRCLLVVICTTTSGAVAQTPPPGTPASLIQRQIDARGLRGMLISRIKSSEMTVDQIRTRLAQLGYDPTTLDPGEGLGYYIENAGGYAQNADEGRTHVRYANGATRVKHKFLLFGSSPRPEAGSIVIVPPKPDKEGSDLASILASITSILVTGATLAIVAIR